MPMAEATCGNPLVLACKERRDEIGARYDEELDKVFSIFWGSTRNDAVFNHNLHLAVQNVLRHMVPQNVAGIQIQAWWSTALVG